MQVYRIVNDKYHTGCCLKSPDPGSYFASLQIRLDGVYLQRIPF